MLNSIKAWSNMCYISGLPPLPYTRRRSLRRSLRPWRTPTRYSHPLLFPVCCAKPSSQTTSSYLAIRCLVTSNFLRKLLGVRVLHTHVPLLDPPLAAALHQVPMPSPISSLAKSAQQSLPCLLCETQTTSSYLAIPCLVTSNFLRKLLGVHVYTHVPLLDPPLNWGCSEKNASSQQDATQKWSQGCI